MAASTIVFGAAAYKAVKNGEGYAVKQKPLNTGAARGVQTTHPCSDVEHNLQQRSREQSTYNRGANSVAQHAKHAQLHGHCMHGKYSPTICGTDIMQSMQHWKLTHAVT